MDTSPSVGQEVESVRCALAKSELFVEVLHRARQVSLPDWYLAGGCVAQTVWNILGDRPPDHGIRDYDLPYFDPSDLSWESEDVAIRAGHEVFAGLPAVVEVRNQARVHLWYEDHFGVPCRPYSSTEAAVDSFPTTATSVGVRLQHDGDWRIYAPYALSDLLGRVVRPNLAQVPRHVYEAKVERWRRQWPELTILAWPEAGTMT